MVSNELLNFFWEKKISGLIYPSHQLAPKGLVAQVVEHHTGVFVSGIRRSLLINGQCHLCLKVLIVVGSSVQWMHVLGSAVTIHMREMTTTVSTHLRFQLWRKWSYSLRLVLTISSKWNKNFHFPKVHLKSHNNFVIKIVVFITVALVYKSPAFLWKCISELEWGVPDPTHTHISYDALVSWATKPLQLEAEWWEEGCTSAY